MQRPIERGTPMKEWQRWERMAREFSSAGDPRREIECINMALELLPPGHNTEKTDLHRRLEGAVSRRAEEGDGAPAPDAFEGLAGALDALGPEDARQTVMEAMRGRWRSREGIEEGAVVQALTEDLGLEEDLVWEAVEDLLDDGLLYRREPDRLVLDGLVSETDLEDAVLSELAGLATSGRGAARDEVVGHLTSRGLARGEVEEAIEELEEAGRLEEGHPGQLRVAMDEEQIEEVHRQVVAALRDQDAGGKGLLQASVVRDLSQRGWEVQEVEEAIEELEDSGLVMAIDGTLRLAGKRDREERAMGDVLAAVRELAETSGGGFSPADVIRAAAAKGVVPELAHRSLDELMDTGTISRDRHGLYHLVEGGEEGDAPRRIVMATLRKLQHGRSGAPRAEVIRRVVAEGLDEEVAEEALGELVDDGQVHQMEDGLLRPG